MTEKHDNEHSLPTIIMTAAQLKNLQYVYQKQVDQEAFTARGWTRPGVHWWRFALILTGTMLAGAFGGIVFPSLRLSGVLGGILCSLCFMMIHLRRFAVEMVHIYQQYAP